MAASLLENGGVPNGTPPETRTDAKNQAESKLAKLLFFNRPERFVARQLDNFRKCAFVPKFVNGLCTGSFFQCNASAPQVAPDVVAHVGAINANRRPLRDDTLSGIWLAGDWCILRQFSEQNCAAS
jgi:hypothetical protein